MENIELEDLITEEIDVLEESIQYVGGMVNSVNGKIGDVVLNAQDVGAATPQSVATAETRANSYTDTKVQQVRQSIPTKTSQLTNDSNFQTASQVTSITTPISNKVDSIDSSINKTVVSNVTITGSASTDTLSLDSGKVNIKTGATSSATVPFPVASATTAGVMNSATFQGLQQTTDIANGLLNGAVAVSGLAAEPTQAQLTTAWETATGRTTLMNRAVLYDITNQKLWTYYTNTSTWYSAAAGGGSVEVQTWTNTQAGIVKGSTSDGQIFAETDGTGSVNGWDEVKTDIENLETAGYQTENDVRDIISETNVADLADGSDYATTAYVDGELADKQDTISDLTSIREGAAAGATAVQPEDLPEIEQTTGTSTTSLMSQNAITEALGGKADNSNFTGTDGTSAGTAGLVPAPATTDAGKFLKSDGTWAEAGGSGPTVVQTTGTSTTDVMSQKAVTDTIFSKNRDTAIWIGHDNYNNKQSQTGTQFANFGSGMTTTDKSGFFRVNFSGGGIGNNSVGILGVASGGQDVAIGNSSSSTAISAVAIGRNASVTKTGGIALGANSGGNITAAGMMDIGTSVTSNGYNNTNYRLLTGLYNGINAHDAATYGQVISYAAINGSSAPTTSTAAKYVGQLYYDTTNAKLYYCSNISGSTYTWSEIGSGGGGTWGSITGTLSDQTDLQDALDGKQDVLDIEDVEEINTAAASSVSIDTVVTENSTNLITSGAVYDAVQTKIETISGATQELANNTEYRANEIATLEVTLPSSLPNDYISSLVFSSGSTATSLTYPSGIKWSGDDVSNNVFVPAASKRYNIIFWYDGANTNAIVRGAA